MMAGFGWDSAEIARRLGYASAQYVDNLLTLAGAPLAVRKMVMDEAVSATAAIYAIHKHGGRAIEVLRDGKYKAGGKKVTAKHLPGSSHKKMVRKHSDLMWTVLRRLSEDPYFERFDTIIRAQVLDVLKEIGNEL